MTSDETYVLAGYVAGYRWKPPAQDWTKHLPVAVVTVSECLTDFLPEDQDTLTAPWHATLQDAVNASHQASAGAGDAQVLAVSIPAAAVLDLAAMIEKWIGVYPHPILSNLTQPHSPDGTVQGFEVLGFETGRFHSWLCYDLLGEAFDKLGVRTNDHGLLDTLAQARQVADSANSSRGTPQGTPEEVTWFPALITEHDLPGS
ncbi:hypothetical protein [Catellatospora citrea]|uniref:Uncharacterized protein n=1 Tax=Catellatospora citrea TaxID=53366 RepID=A0A8J3P201_9ACTN|nr:hypothetical protein [Catellatospora citrea]GIG00752.1 hypothetical protein Cci01nite_58450 [Catellatospora citrea]